MTDGRRKPFRAEDVPPELRGYIDFDSVRWIPREADPRKDQMVGVTCPRCLRHRRCFVANLKLQIKRETFDGRCKSCKSRANIRQLNKTFVGDQHPNWNGGRNKIKQGYIERHPKSFSSDAIPILETMADESRGYVLEHRAIVALSLGRPLASNEYVHHINSDRSDNRLENLQLVDHHKRPICPCCGWRMDEWPK